MGFLSGILNAGKSLLNHVVSNAPSILNKAVSGINTVSNVVNKVRDLKPGMFGGILDRAAGALNTVKNAVATGQKLLAPAMKHEDMPVMTQPVATDLGTVKSTMSDSKTSSLNANPTTGVRSAKPLRGTSFSRRR